MEEHPPLFTSEELKGVPFTPAVTHEETVAAVVTPIAEVPTPAPVATPEAPLTPVFNPAEMVTHPAPENTQLSLAEAAAKYKEMIGVWPNDDLSEEHIRNAITDLKTAEEEYKRIADIERAEHLKELAEQSKGWS